DDIDTAKCLPVNGEREWRRNFGCAIVAMVARVSVARRDSSRTGASGIGAAPGRSPGRGRSWRAPAAARSVNPINLIRSACGRYTDRQLWCPSHTNPKAAAHVLPGCRVIRLDSAISPTPLSLSSKVHVSLDLDPIRAWAEDRSRSKVCSKRRAVYGDWLV